MSNAKLSKIRLGGTKRSACLWRCPWRCLSVAVFVRGSTAGATARPLTGKPYGGQTDAAISTSDQRDFVVKFHVYPHTLNREMGYLPNCNRRPLRGSMRPVGFIYTMLKCVGTGRFYFTDSGDSYVAYASTGIYGSPASRTRARSRAD